jgi:hypothetical protein
VNVELNANLLSFMNSDQNGATVGPDLLLDVFGNTDNSVSQALISSPIIWKQVKRL